MKVIDFHTHVFPDKIAARTIEALLSELDDDSKAYTDGTLEGLKKSMKESAADYSVVLPVVTKVSQFESVNKYAAEINGKDNIISFGGIHPENDNIEEKLDYIKSLGLKGIKLHPDYQKTFIDDERYIKIISYCVKIGLIVSIHAGVDIGLPDVVHCTPYRAEKMIEAVCGSIKTTETAKIVLAHIGGYDLYDEVEQLLVGAPVYFDLSYGLDKIDETRLLRIIRNHGADKVLFATDSPWAGQAEFIEKMNSLPLTNEEKELIMYKNAEKLLGIN